MPLYMINTRPGGIESPAKAAIAADVTRLHCDVTGAPASFVNVFFFEDAPHMPPIDSPVSVFGGIRAGRSAEQKARIGGGLAETIARHTRFTAGDVAVVLHDSPASWSMEGGAVMPEPGEEAAWLAAHASRSAAAIPDPAS